MRIFAAVCLSLALALVSPAGAQTPSPDRWVIVHAGTLLSEAGKPLQTNVSVIVKNRTVQEIRPGAVTAADLKDVPASQVSVVELGGKFVMPGLIDSHVHLTMGQTLTASQEALVGLVSARKTLLAGITTVRDLGGEPDAIFPLRDAINAGRIMGPRILAAGPIVTPTGGHMDPRNHQPDDIDYPMGEYGICDGADDCRTKVRRLVQLGADLIKISPTAGLLDNGSADQNFSDAEIQVLVDTAHGLDRKVAAHAEFNKGIGAAIRAGVDSIEHGNAIDADQIAMAKAKGIYLVPTLSPFVMVSHLPGERSLGARKLFGDGPNPDVTRHLKAAYQAGMKIAMGTDTMAANAGENPKELVLMVQLAGMTPMDAIRASTLGGADLLGITDQVGSIAPGKAADLVATDKSPLDDITEVTRISFVMHNGTEYRGPDVAP